MPYRIRLSSSEQVGTNYSILHMDKERTTQGKDLPNCLDPSMAAAEPRPGLAEILPRALVTGRWAAHTD